MRSRISRPSSPVLVERSRIAAWARAAAWAGLYGACGIGTAAGIETVSGCDPEIHLGSIGEMDASALQGDTTGGAADSGGATPDGTAGDGARADRVGSGSSAGEDAEVDGLGDDGAGASGEDGVPSSILWRADFETGDLSEWTDDNQGGLFQQSVAQGPTVVTSPVHLGTYAAEISISPSNMMVAVNYLYRQAPTPTEAYYGVWIYLPKPYTITDYLNIMHFTGSTTNDDQGLISVWDVDLQTRSDGKLEAYVFQFGVPNFADGGRFDESTMIPVPTEQWVHFEVLFHKAADNTGRFALIQDGTLVLDILGVPTTPTDFLRWNVGPAATDISPSPAEIFIDDATISTTRVDP